jgi:hypothetical protein
MCDTRARPYWDPLAANIEGLNCHAPASDDWLSCRGVFVEERDP